jgi:hypothetical protein
VQSLQNSSRQVRESFSGLNEAQLNWKPEAKKWSIGECIDHLVTTNQKYFPALEKITSGAYMNSFWQRVSPFSGFFGNVLKKGVSPDTVKKMKTAKVFEPTNSSEPLSIISEFVKNNEELSAFIRKLEDVDLRKIKICSPVSSFITYSLDDMLTIITIHEQRHINQAKRVMAMEGFPK